MRVRTLLGCLAIAAVSQASCDSPTSCTPDVEIVDAPYGLTYDARMLIVNLWRDYGFDCTKRIVRDLFGTAIGEEYTCTKCD